MTMTPRDRTTPYPPIDDETLVDEAMVAYAEHNLHAWQARRTRLDRLCARLRAWRRLPQEPPPHWVDPEGDRFCLYRFTQDGKPIRWTLSWRQAIRSGLISPDPREGFESESEPSFLRAGDESVGEPSAAVRRE